MNARYDAVDHPVLGYIKGIRVLDQAIPAGQEILVDYGFDGDHGYPAWWPPLLPAKIEGSERSDDQIAAPRRKRARCSAHGEDVG